MKFFFSFFLCCAVVASVFSNPEHCKKACPRIQKPISAIGADGICETFANNCLLATSMLCQGKEFVECFSGESCEDYNKQIQCGRGL